MPAPTSPYSTDYYLYKYLYTPLAENICFIHPNYISIANMLMSTPLVVYALLNRWSLGAVIAVFLFHIILDCMDGAVARACNKKSKLGADLDSASDILFIAAFGITICYIFIKNYGLTSWKTIIISFLVLVSLILQIQSILCTHSDEYLPTPSEVLFNDNLTLRGVAIGAIAWWLVNKA
jgi:phosphatidylglycerophosphate synthase